MASRFDCCSICPMCALLVSILWYGRMPGLSSIASRSALPSERPTTHEHAAAVLAADELASATSAERV